MSKAAIWHLVDLVGRFNTSGKLGYGNAHGSESTNTGRDPALMSVPPE